MGRRAGKTYSADISAGSLMLPESRRVAEVLLTLPDRDAWVQAIEQDNILQKKSPASARRQARLIRKRLEQLDGEGWRLVAEGERELALQMLLAAAIKHSQLLDDFLREVVAGHVRRMEDVLSPKDWESFLADCAQRDASVAEWSATTKAKLFQVILRILAEARYLQSTRSRKLTLPLLHPEVLRYLHGRSEGRVLAAMEPKP